MSMRFTKIEVLQTLRVVAERSSLHRLTSAHPTLSLPPPRTRSWLTQAMLVQWCRITRFVTDLPIPVAPMTGRYAAAGLALNRQRVHGCLWLNPAPGHQMLALIGSCTGDHFIKPFDAHGYHVALHLLFFPAATLIIMRWGALELSAPGKALPCIRVPWPQLHIG